MPGACFYGGIGCIVNKVKVFLKVGYQLAPIMSNWEYWVSDKDDSSRLSKLPREGFEQHPPALEISGISIQIGFGGSF